VAGAIRRYAVRSIPPLLNRPRRILKSNRATVTNNKESMRADARVLTYGCSQRTSRLILTKHVNALVVLFGMTLSTSFSSETALRFRCKAQRLVSRSFASGRLDSTCGTAISDELSWYVLCPENHTTNSSRGTEYLQMVPIRPKLETIVEQRVALDNT